MWIRRLALILLASVFSSGGPIAAAIQTKPISYRHDGVELKGLLAWDDATQGKRPGVLIVHEWWGLNDYVRGRVIKLAELGYAAFALDMYGDGRVTEHPQEAGQWASQIRSNQDAWRARALAGLDVLRQQEQVDSNRVAAIGYCFGGSTVLQLAYAGAPIMGVVSFHGDPVVPPEGTKISARILVCTGGADDFIPPARIKAFEQALEQAKADYQVITYEGAKHGFSNPEAGKYGLANLKYDEMADRRSWTEMQSFFKKLFGPAAERP